MSSLGGNKRLVCWRASLINFKVVLNLFQNSSSDKIVVVVGFWI